jgi:hypothetical protein
MKDSIETIGIIFSILLGVFALIIKSSISFSPGFNRVISACPIPKTVSTVSPPLANLKPLKRFDHPNATHITRLKPGVNEINQPLRNSAGEVKPSR